MNFEPAEKMKNFEAGIFQILDEKKKELQKQGKKIYNFSVGTPDFETPECVMKAVSEACLHPENYHYSLGETDELLDALAAKIDIIRTLRRMRLCLYTALRKEWHTFSCHSLIREISCFYQTQDIQSFQQAHLSHRVISGFIR